VVWGVVWVVGYLMQALNHPGRAQFWTLAPPLALVVSFWLGSRMRREGSRVAGLQLAGFWGLWVIFGAVWAGLFLAPGTPAGQAFLVSLVAFAFAVSGLMMGWPFVVAGLGLLALDVGLYLLLPDHFPWGMAGVGAAMLAAGLALVRAASATRQGSGQPQ
jgi:hypothetical protein